MTSIHKSFIFLFLILFSNSVFSSHFRSGKISWTVTPGTRTVNFTITNTWRFDDVDPIYFNFGDGNSTGALSGNEILNVPNNYKVIETRVSHTYSNDGPFTASFSGCCRISNLVNAPDYSFTVSTKVCLANSNTGSPISTVPSIIEMGSTGINTYQLPVTDPDGSNISYSLTSISSFNFVPSVNSNVASISSTGLISWNTTGTNVGSLYLMKVKVSDGCAESELEFIIKITACNSGVTGTITGTSSIFQGQSAELTVTFTGFGPWTYRLSGTNTDVTTSVSPVKIMVNPLTTTTYTISSVSGAGGACGIANGSAIVTVNCYNIATLTGDATINSAQSTNLSIAFTGIGPWTYRLSGTSTDVTTNTTPVLIPVTPITTTVYSLTSVSNTSGFCSTSSGSATVTVNCPNIATISGTATITSGQSTDLSIAFSGTGPWSYRLSGTNTDVITSTTPVIIPVTPNTSTNYTLASVTHSNGYCATSSGTAFVTVNCPVVASISGTKTIYKGQSTDLTLSFTGTGPWTYRLSGTNSDITTNVSPVVISVSPTLNTNYSLVSVTHSGGYCALTDGSIAMITVICPVTATISGSATINKGQSTNLQISFTESGPWTYRISGVNQDFVSNVNPAIIPVAPAATTTYTLSSVSNSCGFGTVSGSAAITVIVPVNLISCYNFSGNALDGKSSNHGNVIGASLTTDRFGNANSAYNFNGVNNYISLPDNVFGVPEYTYSAWVNSNNLLAFSQIILSIGNIGADQVLALSNINQTNGGQIWNFFSYIYLAALPTPFIQIPTSNVINEWHHVVAIRTLNELKLFIDGSLVGTTSSTGLPPVYATPIKATIGARSRNDIQFFSGKIDDVKIYDGAIKEEEVAYLYNEESGSNQCSDFCTKFVYSLASGNWNDPMTWSCNRVPLSTDVVLVKQSHSVTIDNITANAKSVILGGTINYLNNGNLILNQ